MQVGDNICWFFGNAEAGRSSGHYFYTEPWEKVCELDEMTPWAYKVDAELAPKTQNYQTQGLVKRHVKDGWTALAFWDRTGDARPGSNTAFFFNRVLTYEDAIARAKEAWPRIFERLDRAGIGLRLYEDEPS